MGIRKAERERQNPRTILESIDPNSESFNFEIWAIAVRSQMLAALEKRVRDDWAEPMPTGSCDEDISESIF